LISFGIKRAKIISEKPYPLSVPDRSLTASATLGRALQRETRHTFVSEIASRYGKRLRSFFTQRLRNRDDAPDLAQEVFLRLMRVEHHESIRSPEAYLFTVASHVLHQHTLRQSNTPASVDISEVFASLQLVSGDDPLARADAQQTLDEIDRVLKRLPAKFSSTLLLHRLGGLSLDEIALQMGVSRPAAKKYLARALMQCRNVLEEGESKETP
jgi:RNA polymerase sigma factor (sigma-70 family)